MINVSDLTATALPQHLSSAGRIATSTELRHLDEVLWYLRAKGPTSRAEIPAGCHISPSTTTDLVHELKARRLIHEVPTVRAARGRPKQPITIEDGSPCCVVGVHLSSPTVVSSAATLGAQRAWHQRTMAAPDPHDPGPNGSRPEVATLGRSLRRQQATIDTMAEAAPGDASCRLRRVVRRRVVVGPMAPGGVTEPTTLYIRAEGEWQDAFVWLSKEGSAVANRLYNLQALNTPTVGVDVTACGVPDPNQPVPLGARPRQTAKKAPAEMAAARPWRR